MHVVHVVVQVVTPNEPPLLVMKRYERSLDDLLADAPSRRLPLAEVLRIGAQLAKALSELHEINIILRDLVRDSSPRPNHRGASLVPSSLAQACPPSRMACSARCLSRVWSAEAGECAPRRLRRGGRLRLWDLLASRELALTHHAHLDQGHARIHAARYNSPTQPGLSPWTTAPSL